MVTAWPGLGRLYDASRARHRSGRRPRAGRRGVSPSATSPTAARSSFRVRGSTHEIFSLARRSAARWLDAHSRSRRRGCGAASRRIPLTSSSPPATRRRRVWDHMDRPFIRPTMVDSCGGCIRGKRRAPAQQRGAAAVDSRRDPRPRCMFPVSLGARWSSASRCAARSAR